MDPQFWHQRWQDNEIGFHLEGANPLLIKYFGKLGLVPGDRVFLPLCGKTLDIVWLLDRGYVVAGAELSRKAVAALFEQLGMEPQVMQIGPVEQFRAPGIDIFVGDIFDLTSALLRPVDAVYDRAALVALPESMRRRYTEHLVSLTQAAPQLLISYQYDRNRMAGPPFSVSRQEVRQHYEPYFQVDELEEVVVPGGLKGITDATEGVWHLRNS